MADDSDYQAVQNPAPGYTGSNQPVSPYGAGQPAKKPPPSLPEVEYVFFVLSTALSKQTEAFIRSSVSLGQAIWRPDPKKDNYDAVKKFEVTCRWNGGFKTVEDKDGNYKRIDFPLDKASEKALKLVADNFSNPNFDPVIPVFICYSAWDELNEPGAPRAGLLNGFTLVKSLPWFSGERAILLFSSAAGPKTLAHELSHWCGFTHAYFKDNPDNVGYIGGGGFDIDREQLRKYYKWATEIGFRKTLAGK